MTDKKLDPSDLPQGARRTSARATTYADSSVKISFQSKDQNQSGNSIDVRVVDHGFTGARFLAEPNMFIKQGARFLLEVKAGSPLHTYRIEAEIRWVKESEEGQSFGSEFTMPMYGAPYSLRQPRVLLADNDPDVRASIKKLIESEGYFVLGISRAMTAEMCDEFRPDIMVVDLTKRSGENPLGLIDELSKKFPNIKIIAIADENTASQGILADAEKKGAMFTVQKPFERSVLIMPIMRALAADAFKK